ncbi:hypothetical protein L0F63_002107 [Massospora cicadina]|nr:hypothetical protein L0F63_002107 [Massospora cicadina]
MLIGRACVTGGEVSKLSGMGFYEVRKFDAVSGISKGWGYLRVFGVFSLGLLIAWWQKVLVEDRPPRWEVWTLDFIGRRGLGDVYVYDPPVSEGGLLADKAYHHILRLGMRVHSYATDEIDSVERYLLSYVKAIQRFAQSRGVTVEVDFDRRTNLVAFEKVDKLSRAPRRVPVYFEASNLVVRVVGRRTDALLISAHHDSHASSHGASDDGVSVAVALEVLRDAALKTPENTLVVLLDSAEEKGLMGSRAFTQHKWFEAVRAVINLEASGVGGRALLFQTNSDTVLKAFVRAPHPFGTSIGNDAYTRGVLNSRTDFEVYRAANLTGVDLALCSNRAFYHTSQDDAYHVYYSSLTRFGETVLSATRTLLRSPSLDGKPLRGGVFFDVLGYAMVFLTQRETLSLIIFTMGLLALGIHLRHGTPLWGLVAITGGIGMYAIAVAAATRVWASGEGIHLHGHALAIHVSFSLLGLGCMDLSLSLWAHHEKVPMAKLERPVTSSLALFWLLVQIANLVLVWKGFSSLYPTLTLALAHLGVLAVDVVRPPPRLRSKARLVICLLPSVMMQEVAMTLLLSLAQGIPTGSHKLTTYRLVSITSMLPVLGIVPILPFGPPRPFRIAALSLSAWLLSSVFTYSRFPLSPSAPMSIHFEQHVCATPDLGCQGITREMPVHLNNNVSFVRTIASSYLEAALAAIPSARRHPLSPTVPYYHMTQKFYVGEPPTLPLPLPRILNVSVATSSEAGFTVRFDGYGSRICGLRLHDLPLIDLTTRTHPTSTEISLIPNATAPQDQFMLMRRSPDHPFLLNFLTRSPPAFPIRISAWCGYDDIDRHIPALGEARTHLPSWAILSTTQATLLTVHGDVLIAP